MHEVIIIVPCYNESKRIETDKFREFSKSHAGISFMLVNDGSTDRTLDKLHDLAEFDLSHFMVLDLPRNSGKAEAVRAGTARSLELGPKYVGIWDADLATPLTEIPRFVHLMEQKPEVLMVFGARVKLMGRTIVRPAARHYLGRISATLISVTLGLPIYDTQCGAKMFRVNDDLQALFGEQFLSSWIFDVEIVARLISRYNGKLPEDSIYELPLNEWIHKSGSKIKPMDYLLALRELLLIRQKYL